MTDALAQWFLLQTERADKPWQTMGTFSPIEQDQAPHGAKEEKSEAGDAPAGNPFADWIERLRDQGDLRNDDVTLLVIQM